MGENDTARLRIGDIPEALGLLTRLPVRSGGERGAAAAWAWPIAGAVVAAMAAAMAGVALWLGLSSWIAAGVALGVQVILTGAMHEDGLADCADGLWGGWDRETRLEIMKDSRIGAYGVIALSLSLMFRWSLIYTLFDAGFLFGPLVITAALSRVPMVGLMCWLAPAKPRGLAVDVGRPDQETVLLALITALLIALLFGGFIALPAALVAIILGVAVAKIATAKIGGQTGDVLGASQQVVEIGVLMALAALLG